MEPTGHNQQLGDESRYKRDFQPVPESRRHGRTEADESLELF